MNDRPKRRLLTMLQGPSGTLDKVSRFAFNDKKVERPREVSYRNADRGRMLWQ